MSQLINQLLKLVADKKVNVLIRGLALLKDGDEFQLADLAEFEYSGPMEGFAQTFANFCADKGVVFVQPEVVVNGQPASQYVSMPAFVGLDKVQKVNRIVAFGLLAPVILKAIEEPQ